MSLVKGLHPKSWTMLHPLRGNTAAGMTMIDSEGPDQSVMIFGSNTTGNYLYNWEEDGPPVTLPSPALAGTFGAGACGRYHPAGPTGTAAAGSGATLLKTTLSLLADLRPHGDKYFKGFVTGGTGAGQYFECVSNSCVTGASDIVIRAVGGGALGTALDNTSTYVLYTGRFFCLSAGTLAAGSFKYYDWATKAWSGSLTITGLPATLGTDCKMVATPSVYATFATGTATAGGASTLTNGAKAWATNQWANAQVRITDGTGKGQTRTVASNTGTALTNSVAWTVNPDATSVYEITGNDDYLYVLGNNAVTLYRYSISGNTWSTLAPGAARSAAAATGCSANWVFAASPSDWTSESAIMNGRRIYSFRGGAGTALDYYDIAANTWVSTIAYGNLAEVFGAGSCYSYYKDRIYVQKDATGLIFALDIPSMSLVPILQWLPAQSTAVVGDKLCVVEYVSAGKTLAWLYNWNNTQATGQRMLIV